MGNGEARDHQMKNLMFESSEQNENESLKRLSLPLKEESLSCWNSSKSQVDITVPDCPPPGNMSPRLLINRTSSAISDDLSNPRSSSNLQGRGESSTGDSLCLSTVGELPSATGDTNNALEWTGSESVEVLEREVDKYMLKFGIHNTFINAEIPNDLELRPSRTEPEPYLSQLNKYIDKNVTSSEGTVLRPIQNKYILQELTPEYLSIIPCDENGNLTSIGSLDHAQGTCRPCAFIHNPKREGCENGVNCAYCHFVHPKKKKPPRPSKQQRLLKKLARAAAANSGIEETSIDVKEAINNTKVLNTDSQCFFRSQTTLNNQMSLASYKRLNTASFDFADGYNEPVVTTKMPSYRQLFENKVQSLQYQDRVDNAGRTLLSILQQSSLGKNNINDIQQESNTSWGTSEVPNQSSPILYILSEAGRKTPPNHRMVSQQYMPYKSDFSHLS